MASQLTKASLFIATALGALAASPALAQSDDGASTAGDIIVTARRVEEKLQDVPISITVFTQQQLESRNVLSGEDLTKYTPSLSVNTRFGTDRLTFAIRGFNQETGTAPSVGTYFNDVVGLRAATVLVPGGDGAGPGAFFDLQNVQVLKGPQGTLFGLNTTGGAVMLVPRKPTDKLEGFVQGGIGSYKFREISGVVNLPVSDTLRLRFGVEHKKRDGYMINRSGIGPRDFNDVNYVSARASMVWDVTPDIENYTVATYSKSDTHGAGAKLTAATTNLAPGSEFLAATVGIPALAQLANAAANNYGFYDFDQSTDDAQSHLKQWQVINTTTWKASDSLTVKNIASYGRLKSFVVTPLIGTNWNTSTIASTGLVQPGYPYHFFVVHGDLDLPTSHQSTFTEEFRLSGQTADDRLNWQAGVYYQSSKPVGWSGLKTPTFASCSSFSTLTCSNIFVFPAGSISWNRSKTTYENVGLYAQGTYKLSDHFKVTGGFRYTWDKETWEVISINQYLVDAPASGVAFSVCTFGGDANCYRKLSGKSSKPTWLIDLEYSPTPDYLLYAKYSRGYRSGAVQVGIPAPFNYTQPEKLDAYEIGAKTTFRGAVKGTFNIAAFYNDFFNQQLQLNFNQIPGGPPSTAIPVNAGQSRMYGLEVGLNLEPVEGLVLTGDYTYLNTKILSMPDLSGIGGGLYIVASQYAPGQPLPQSPRHKFVIGATYCRLTRALAMSPWAPRSPIPAASW